jgi:hypothetical protein
MSRVICLGNGEALLGIDLDRLRQYATIWGCNALYRDFTPDFLVCVDIEMSHEIYRSGYAFKNVVYFRDWSRLPEEAYELVVTPSHISQRDIIDLESYIHVSPRVEGWNEFAISGQELDKLLKLREDYLTACLDKGIEVNPDTLDIILGEKRAGLWVTWLAPEDKVRKTESMAGNTDYSFCSGALCNALASLDPETEEIYLLGMDLYSSNEKPNNVYKGTDCYIRPDGDPIPPDNWIDQHRMIFEKFPHIKYYKVNPKPLSKDINERINTVIEEWIDIPNLEYITQDEMYERFHKVKP